MLLTVESAAAEYEYVGPTPGPAGVEAADGLPVWPVGTTFKQPEWETDERFVHVAGVMRAMRAQHPEVGLRVLPTMVPDMNLCSIRVDKYMAVTVRKCGTKALPWAASSDSATDITTEAGQRAVAERALLALKGQPETFSAPPPGAPAVDVSAIAAAPAATDGPAAGNILHLCAPVTPGLDLFAEVDAGDGLIFRLEDNGKGFQVRVVADHEWEGEDIVVKSWRLLKQGMETLSDGLRAMADEIDRVEAEASKVDAEESGDAADTILGGTAQRAQPMANRVPVRRGGPQPLAKVVERMVAEVNGKRARRTTDAARKAKPARPAKAAKPAPRKATKPAAKPAPKKAKAQRASVQAVRGKRRR